MVENVGIYYLKKTYMIYSLSLIIKNKLFENVPYLDFVLWNTYKINQEMFENINAVQNKWQRSYM